MITDNFHIVYNSVLISWEEVRKSTKTQSLLQREISSTVSNRAGEKKTRIDLVEKCSS